jgi:hypothetical protein
LSIIKGTAYWASIQTPNTKFEPVWSIDVCQLDDSAKEILKADGLGDKIKNKADDRGDFITVKQKVTGAKGQEFEAPRVVDANKRPFMELVGNGSTVAVQYRPREWEYAGKAGIAADLKAVQVLDHVAYAGSEEFDSVEAASGGSVEDFDDLPLAAAG